jgi:Skp family chaperone for outer membrane proteins
VSLVLEEGLVQNMKLRTVAASLLALSTVAMGVSTPVFAQKSATSISIKVGYFNLALVKASYPEAAGAELLRTQAENELREYVRKGNESLQKAQEDKKPKEELEKLARDLQLQINAQQQALIQLVQTQNTIATQNIAQAVNTIAKDKGLDLVFDGAGVFSGGDKIVNNGEDITEPVIKKLAPASQIRTGGVAPTEKK